MPELPDITVYLEALEARILGQRLEKVRLASPFLLRTAVPPIAAAEGREVVALRRLGKAIALECDFFLTLHIMIASHLHREERGRSSSKTGRSPSKSWSSCAVRGRGSRR